MNSGGGGGGGTHQLDQREHTPLYENDTKETKNRPMETTSVEKVTKANQRCQML